MKLMHTCLFLLLLAVRPGSAAPTAAGHVTRHDLAGAWRLVRIDYRGPRGALEDPFYHRGSAGLLMYDRSGAMSVQIAGVDRPALEVPAARPAEGGAAAATTLDSYYAYYGTWDLDTVRATVTHHVTHALYATEDGSGYTQEVALIDGRLVMTNRHREGDGEYVRTKTWERVAGSP
jgi:hypothetical protein